ncbi:hypothetical protein DQ237_12200 [Blastococcus sp. TF02-8]|uniref:SDR family oxidoreductase n=1 Tax=Blastococcus sp. TF02-8 TaxID=2250574 RepID=UPI000DE84AB9|nr:SDR family oxidoreductase [Blastococcus sp. TF02-8]RBY95895.1 hypothetical protein DQ237_12200 [Blastococcus sp. TF02-8]
MSRAAGTAPRVLLTGATGVVGTAVAAALRPDVDLVTVGRRPSDLVDVHWDIGRESVPESLRTHWDVVVHTAASTRWTMTKDEATLANIVPLGAVLDLIDDETHLVHVSTAYVEGEHGERTSPWQGFRNSYEWSKAECELIARRRAGRLTIVRPPLVLGSRGTGRISRFSGPYTVLQALTSGMAAALIGSPGGFAEIAAVDEVAASIAAAALSEPRDQPVVIGAGAAALTLEVFVTVVCETLNEWRRDRRIAPIEVPPTIDPGSWHRFFRPLSDQYLTPLQQEGVRLLGMFESYTSMSRPFSATSLVENPAEVLSSSVRYWAERKPRLASRTPEPWRFVA